MEPVDTGKMRALWEGVGAAEGGSGCEQRYAAIGTCLMNEAGKQGQALGFGVTERRQGSERHTARRRRLRHAVCFHPAALARPRSGRVRPAGGGVWAVQPMRRSVRLPGRTVVVRMTVAAPARIWDSERIENGVRQR